MYPLPTIYVLSKTEKITKKKDSSENFHFLQLKKTLYIAWTCFCNDGKLLKVLNTNFRYPNHTFHKRHLYA